MARHHKTMNARKLHRRFGGGGSLTDSRLELAILNAQARHGWCLSCDPRVLERHRHFVMVAKDHPLAGILQQTFAASQEQGCQHVAKVARDQLEGSLDQPIGSTLALTRLAELGLCIVEPPDAKIVPLRAINPELANRVNTLRHGTPSCGYKPSLFAAAALDRPLKKLSITARVQAHDIYKELQIGASELLEANGKRIHPQSLWHFDDPGDGCRAA